MNTSNLQPAIVTGIFNVGHLPDLYSEEQTEILIVALETERRTHYLKCDLPIGEGGAIHLLAQVTSGFSLNHRDVKPGELLGKAAMVELIPSESFSALRSVKQFPCAPRYQPAGLRLVSTDSRLTGRQQGALCVIGGARQVTAPQLPSPPAPRTKLTAWSVSDLREAKLPQGLPLVVVQMAMRSLEWRELEAEAAPVTSKRR